MLSQVWLSTLDDSGSHGNVSVILICAFVVPHVARDIRTSGATIGAFHMSLEEISPCAC
jgi:hypothetical protein